MRWHQICVSLVFPLTNIRRRTSGSATGRDATSTAHRVPGRWCQNRLVIIVSGFLKVDPDDRASYLEGCHHVVEAARACAGCVDFHISADLIEAERVNIFEQWESSEEVEAFRGSGPTDHQQAAIVEARVMQHEITRSVLLT